MSITANPFNHVGLDGLLMMEWGFGIARTATLSEAPRAPFSDLLWLLILQYG
jgi:hypothetical protein